LFLNVDILTEYKGGDGRYRKGFAHGALDVGRVILIEQTTGWQDKPACKVTLEGYGEITVLEHRTVLVDRINLLLQALQAPRPTPYTERFLR